jgi:hypothetical protein
LYFFNIKFNLINNIFNLNLVYKIILENHFEFQNIYYFLNLIFLYLGYIFLINISYLLLFNKKQIYNILEIIYIYFISFFFSLLIIQSYSLASLLVTISGLTITLLFLITGVQSLYYKNVIEAGIKYLIFNSLGLIFILFGF